MDAYRLSERAVARLAAVRSANDCRVSAWCGSSWYQKAALVYLWKALVGGPASRVPIRWGKCGLVPIGVKVGGGCPAAVRRCVALGVQTPSFCALLES